MSPLRVRALDLALLAVATLSCNPQGSPVAPRPTDATVETGAVVRTASAPVGDFRTSPVADATQVIRVGLDQTVTISGARFTPTNPSDELKLEVEWGDGQRSANGCGPCRVDHVYAAGTYDLIATVHDRRFADRGTFTQTFQVVVGASAPETPSPTTFCHSIVTGTGGACPSGATQFCKSSPIVATSSADAQTACNACFGAGICVNGNNGAFAGDFWRDPANSTLFLYVDLLPGLCAPGPLVAGDIVSSGCPSPGRWAP